MRIKKRKVDQTQVRGPFQCCQLQQTASLLSIFTWLKTIKYCMVPNPVISSLFPPSLLPCLSYTYLLSFHYILSSLFLPFLYCICPAASLSPYQKVTEWFRSTAQSLSAKGHEQLFPFLESTCHSLISFNSLSLICRWRQWCWKTAAFSDVVVTFTTDLVIALPQCKGALLCNFSHG